MKIIKPAAAGTMESSDVIIRIEPAEKPGLEIHLTSSVMQQFSRQIEEAIRGTLTNLGVEDARVEAVDKGALDCTIKARTSAAAFRAAGRNDYDWRVKQ